MEVIFAKNYLKELYMEGKSSEKKHRFQKDIIKRYRKAVDKIAEAIKPEDLLPAKAPLGEGKPHRLVEIRPQTHGLSLQEAILAEIRPLLGLFPLHFVLLPLAVPIPGHQPHHDPLHRGQCLA